MRVRAPQIEQLVTDRMRQLFGEPASLIEAAERFRLKATLPLDTALVIPARVRAATVQIIRAKIRHNHRAKNSMLAKVPKSIPYAPP